MFEGEFAKAVSVRDLHSDVNGAGQNKGGKVCLLPGRQPDRQTEKDRQTDKQTDRQTEKRKDRQTDKQTDRQTDS